MPLPAFGGDFLKGGNMKKNKFEKEETLIGFILPSNWDNDDNVTGISISTDDDEYMVENNKLGEELFDFLDEDVRVTGLVTDEKDGTKRITISDYEILELADEEESLDYGDEEDEYRYDEDDIDEEDNEE
jgi:hypothetical protein